MPEKEIYKAKTGNRGLKPPLPMVFEKMSELQKETCKALLDKENVADLADEVANLELLLVQVKIMFYITDEVKTRLDYKMARLSKMFEET